MCAFAFAFASCEQNGGNEVPEAKEKAYVAISLSTTDGTTRAGEEFSEGSDDERAVNSAFVLFYKNGVAFPVDGANYKAIAVDGNANQNPETPNVSDYKNAVLVIEEYQGEYPNQLVALLNYNPALIEGISSMSLETLCATVKDLQTTGTTGGFVMTNSVYVDETGEAVYAYPLTQSNIAMSADAALEAPVQIYVERTAAKVQVTTTPTDHKFELANTTVPVEGQATQVYSKVLGWELSNFTNSPLVKEIDAAWTNDGLHLNPWNDAARHRSYWAAPRTDSFAGFEPGDNAAEWSYDENFKYTGENTKGDAKLVLKCQLQDADGNALEIAKWLGKDYVTRANLLIAVANNIKYSYYYKDTEGYYHQISNGDLEAVLGNGTDAKVYQTYFKLKAASETKEWYKLTNGAFAPIAQSPETAVADMNAELRKIEPAILYADGYTYYHTPVSHAFYTDTEGKTQAVNGVVRNHAYSINIRSIAGYGTPINTGFEFIVPETPAEIETFVAAEIKILSWKNVSYDVDIK